jgi:hypothetical protein
MADGDNAPIGLLLCTSKDEALVEYALPGLDTQLFVSRYQLELPKKDELERFLTDQRREISSPRADISGAAQYANASPSARISAADA